MKKVFNSLGFCVSILFFVMAILFAIGFRVTYAPELDINWTATAAVGTMAAVLVAVKAVIKSGDAVKIAQETMTQEYKPFLDLEKTTFTIATPPNAKEEKMYLVLSFRNFGKSVLSYELEELKVNFFQKDGGKVEYDALKTSIETEASLGRLDVLVPTSEAKFITDHYTIPNHGGYQFENGQPKQVVAAIEVNFNLRFWRIGNEKEKILLKRQRFMLCYRDGTLDEKSINCTYESSE